MRLVSLAAILAVIAPAAPLWAYAPHETPAAASTALQAAPLGIVVIGQTFVIPGRASCSIMA